MWNLIVDGVRIAQYGSKDDAVNASLRQPYGCQIVIKLDCGWCPYEFCPVAEGVREKCPYKIG